MSDLQVTIHRHLPGGFYRIEMVKGDERAPITGWWDPIEGQAHASQLARMVGAPAPVTLEWCDECRELHENLAAAAAAPRPRRGASAPEPAPVVGTVTIAPPSLVASAEEAPV